MEDFVIVQEPDGNGSTKVFGPYSFEAAELAIQSQKARDRFAYTILLLRSPIELRAKSD